MKYLEEYQINGVTYGIAKASEWIDKKAKGYMVWMMGCGGWEHDKLAGARIMITTLAREEAQKKLSLAEKAIKEARDTIITLGFEPLNLKHFKVKPAQVDIPPSEYLKPRRAWCKGWPRCKCIVRGTTADCPRLPY